MTFLEWISINMLIDISFLVFAGAVIWKLKKFDNKIISYSKILEHFFEFHDPTTLNVQGPDRGTQYRSEIFYLNDKQKSIAEKVKKKVNEEMAGKVVTNITLSKNYCPAEEYHQRYLEKR